MKPLGREPSARKTCDGSVKPHGLNKANGAWPSQIFCEQTHTA